MNYEAKESSVKLEYKDEYSLKRRINIHNTLKKMAYKMGMYSKFCEVCVRREITTRDPDTGDMVKKYVIVNEERYQQMLRCMIPYAKKICGFWYGENPSHPDHPINSWSAEKLLKQRRKQNELL